MALWGTKKKEDTDGTTNGPAEPASGMIEARTSRAPAVNAAPAAPAPAAVSASTLRFGIDHTIQLMRSLPTDKDPSLVVTVMKATLESVNVRVPDIIKDAEKRLGEVAARVVALKTEIAAYEREMDVRLQEIVKLESAHAEVVRVREFLQVNADIPVSED